jgi:hypothetical protein
MPRKPMTDRGADPLGKPLARYGTNTKAFMLMATAVVLGLSGGVVVANADWLALALADSQESTAYTFVGWTLLVAGMGTMAWGVWGMSAFFELRRKGVRFTQRRGVTELRWKEIEDIQVHKSVFVHRGSRHVSWEVYIYGREATIYLSSGFLRLVPSVSELLNMLKSVSGIEVILPETLY